MLVAPKEKLIGKRRNNGLCVALDPDLRRFVEDYREHRDLPSLGYAVRELLHIGAKQVADA